MGCYEGRSGILHKGTQLHFPSLNILVALKTRKISLSKSAADPRWSEPWFLIYEQSSCSDIKVVLFSYTH